MRPHLSVTPGGLLFLALLCLTLEERLLLAAALAAAVHEMGHLIVLRALGAPCSLTVEAGGARITPGAISYRGETAAALAGPAAGAVLAAVCALLARMSPSETLSLTAGVSLSLTLFNLLPVRPLDGERILRVWLTEKLGERGERIADRVSAAFCVLLAAASCALAFTHQIWTPIPAAVLLVIRNSGQFRRLHSSVVSCTIIGRE